MTFAGMMVLPLLLIGSLLTKIFGNDFGNTIANISDNLSDLINQWFETPGNAEMLDNLYNELAGFIQQLQQGI